MILDVVTDKAVQIQRVRIIEYSRDDIGGDGLFLIITMAGEREPTASIPMKEVRSFRITND